MRVWILVVALSFVTGTPHVYAALAGCRASDAELHRSISEIHTRQRNVGLAAASVFVNDALLFAPGSDSKYSSSNYNLIAAVIEQVTDRNFKDVISTTILEPLNLTDTRFDNVLRPLSFRARRYSYYHPWTYAESDELFLVPVWDYSFNMGGGNLVATATDLARFGAALAQPRLLPEAELSLLQSVEWFGDVDDNGQAFIYASGANPGLQAGLAVIPESGIAAVVLSNTWGLGSRSGEMTRLALSLAQLCDSAPQ